MTPLAHINAEGHVAAVYGLEEAVFLDSLMFWWRTNRGNGRNFRDSRWWTYNSVKAFEEIFPWWNGGQIRRIIARCREKGALLAGNYNEDQRDRTAWYTPSDRLLELYGESANCICRNQQMEMPKTSETFAENGKCNIRKPCSNHVETDMTPYSPPEGDGALEDKPEAEAGTAVEAETAAEAGAEAGTGVEPQPRARTRRARNKKSIPVHAPERFEQFWAAYPGGGSRLKAVEQWDALAPSDELIDEMAQGLSRQMASRLWQEGIGIPHAFRWLRDRRWTDKLPEVPPPRSTGGWADDPEVTR